MKNLFKYIVVFFLAFNMPSNVSAQVSFEPAANDDKPDTTIRQAVNSPHPSQIREQIDSMDSYITQTLYIGGYFNLRYPGDNINGDFENDIAQMFPELTPEQVRNRTTFVRNGVRLYRWGMEKYNEIKEKLLVPPEPPLVVDDDEYAEIDRSPYIQAEPGQFAIIYDFKKVVPYSSNPRDIEAARARSQRLADAKKNKTNFDKFKSMIDKIEFSKIPYYGDELPNPLVGNAGISSWQQKEGFQARLVTELAEYAQAEEFLGGVHVVVPNHRFILALNLSPELQKPKFELLNAENVESIDFYYPMPEKVASGDMIGGYSGDLLFPFKIKPQTAGKPVNFEVRFSFENCDARLDCQKIELTDMIGIEVGEFNNYNSFQNFIRQSYYHLPEAENGDFSVENITVDLADDEKTVENIHIVFDYSGIIRNPKIFLEDGSMTVFEAPVISVDRKKVYVSIRPLSNQDKLLNQKMTLTAQFNPIDKIRQEIVPTQKTTAEDSFYEGLKKVAFGALAAGLLMLVTPVGFLIFMTACRVRETQPSFKICRQVAAGIAVGVIAAAAAAFWCQAHQVFLFWGMQYQLTAYMTAVFVVILSVKNMLYSRQTFIHTLSPKTGIILSLLLVFAAPLSFAPYLAEAFIFSYQASPWHLAVFAAAFAAALVVPYLIAGAIPLNIPEKLKQTGVLLASFLTTAQLIIMFLLILSQFSFGQTFKIMAVITVLYLFIRFLFFFESALQRTDLPVSQKRGSEIVLLVLLTIATIVAIIIEPRFVPQKGAESAVPYALIEEKIAKGQTFIVRVNSDRCLPCYFINAVTFSPYNLSVWRQHYNVEVIDVNATAMDPDLAAYLTRFHRVAPPLSVLYNYQVKDGLAFPAWVSESYISETLQNLATRV